MRSLRIALLSIAASSMLGLSVYAGVSGKAGTIDTAVATGNEIVLEVTELYKVEVYRYSNNYGRDTNQFPVLQLKNPGNYFYLNQTLDSLDSKTTFNKDGHIIRVGSCTEYTSRFSVSVTSSSNDHEIYFTEEDYHAGNKINIPGISKLKKMEIVVGSGTSVGLTQSNVMYNFSYDEGARTYTLLPAYEAYLSYSMANFNLAPLDDSGSYLGKVFELDAIRLTYECE